MWLVLPLIALRYWQVWDQLPAYMATHFDAANRPNGWMPRATAMWYGLAITAFLLTIFTVVLYVAQRKREVTWFSWALVAFFYLVIALIYRVNSGLVDYSLSGRAVNVTPMIIALPNHAVKAEDGIFLISSPGEDRSVPHPEGKGTIHFIHLGAPRRLWDRGLVKVYVYRLEGVQFKALLEKRETTRS